MKVKPGDNKTAAAAGPSRLPASYAEYVLDLLKTVFRQGVLTKFDMWVGQTLALRTYVTVCGEVWDV